MSNEDNLFGIEDLDDTRADAEHLRAIPMSAPVKRHRKKAKFDIRNVPREAAGTIKVVDRYGNEQPDMVEYDPNTGEGKRYNFKNGQIEDCYLYNGYVVADGQGHPDEEELPEIVQNTRRSVRYPQFHEETVVGRMVDTLKTNPRDAILSDLRCPKCQSGIRFDDDQHDIVCTNGACGMTWHSDGPSGLDKS